jgi:hypothetical protein
MARINKKTVPVRVTQFIASWKEYAPNQVFADMTLEEFTTKAEESDVARDSIIEVNTKLKGLKLQRDQTDKALKDDLILIAHSIRGNKAYGEDCPFYRSLGFVPKSERKSGLKRVQSGLVTPVQSPGEANAA